MRNVLRLAYRGQFGHDWQSQLHGGAREAIEHAERQAERNGWDLADPWDGVDIAEMAKVIRSTPPAGIDHVWKNEHVAAVDLDRLGEYRGRNFHLRGDRPSSQLGDQEAGAMIQRLRVTFEFGVERSIEDGPWWPYIESVTSTAPECSWSRSSGLSGVMCKLSEGDVVTLDVHGVHPRGDHETLRYRFLHDPAAWHEAEWTADNSFRFTVPRKKKGLVTVEITEAGHDQSFGELSIVIEVRPAWLAADAIDGAAASNPVAADVGGPSGT